MRNPLVNSLLLDARAAIKLGMNADAHRLLCHANRVAVADRTIPVHRVRAIETARLNIALAI